jgi:hypothetical protein
MYIRNNMKPAIKHLSFWLIMVCFLSTCKKNNSDEPPAITKIKQLSFLYDDHINIPDRSQVDFSFDGYDRVKKILIYLGDSGIVIPPIDTVTVVNFFYNGANKLPDSVFIIKQLYTTWEWHLLSYDGNGRVIKDSIRVPYPQDYSVTYSYSGNKTMCHNSSLGSFGNDTLVNENGNFIQILKGGTIVNYEFDNKVNPLNNLNIGSIFHVIIGSPVAGLWSMWSASNKNNLTADKTYVNGVLQPNPLKITYSYNEKGLPKKRFWFNSYSPATVQDTMTYKY